MSVNAIVMHHPWNQQTFASIRRRALPLSRIIPLQWGQQIDHTCMATRAVQHLPAGCHLAFLQMAQRTEVSLYRLRTHCRHLLLCADNLLNSGSAVGWGLPLSLPLL